MFVSFLVHINLHGLNLCEWFRLTDVFFSSFFFFFFFVFFFFFLSLNQTGIEAKKDPKIANGFNAMDSQIVERLGSRV